MTSPEPDCVRIPSKFLWMLRVGGAALGCGLAFVVRPLVRWTTSTVDSAPAPLRIAAQIPLPWLVPILALVGLGVGHWLSYEAKRDSPTVLVGDDGLTLSHGLTERYIPHSRVGAVFTDPKDLVVLATTGREVFRSRATDLPEQRLAGALRRRGYPWNGAGDPNENHYQRWVDGHPSLDDHTHTLLRARQRALANKNQSDADDLHGQLQDHGIIVRDRDKAQQYRQLSADHDPRQS